MKIKTINLISGVALVAGLAVSPGAFASNSPDVTKALADSTALELPTRAANLVAIASPIDRQHVAVTVVKAAIGMNPNATVSIVSTMSFKNPSVAPTIAVTAATLQHKRIGLITKAAIAGAPSEVLKIVAALLKEFPQDYYAVAVAAAESAPASGREILLLVADSVPSLQYSIQSAIAGIAPNSAVVPVQAILSQNGGGSAPTVTTPVAPTVSQPTLAPPFTTPTGVVPTVSISNTSQRPPGTRPYPAP
jgi:predicted metal-dependent enzyme (double-stranded beta helix superfamily)